MDYFTNKQSCKIYCKDDPNFALTIRDDKVVLAPANSNDEYQHWYRDEKYGSIVKDASFSLINKATGLAIMHPAAPSQPVQLTPSDPNKLDESILWTEDENMGDGYTAIRMVNDVSLNFDAKEGRAGDGVDLICYRWTGGNNQLWNIEPYNLTSNDIGTTYKIYCKKGPNFSLTIRDGMVILARSNRRDNLQHWYKDEKFNEVKDMFGFPSFALVNKATGQAIRHSETLNQPVQLIPYNRYILDESVLWTADGNLGDGYSAIRMTNNIVLNFDAFEGRVEDGVRLICYPWCGEDNQKWIIEPYYGNIFN